MSQTKKVLVVDDEAINRIFLEKVLEKNGNTVVLAKNGYEALNIFEMNEFDIIFIDYYMPLMNGLELAKRIRNIACRRNKKSHLVITTAIDSSDNLISDLLVGEVDRVLCKPINRDDVLSIINEN